MANNIEVDLRTGRTFAVSDGYIGKALEIFINLQIPDQVKILEENMRDLLQGKTDHYEYSEEHTKLTADKETAAVKSFIGEKEPLEGLYPTIDIYWLVCKYNISVKAMTILMRGEHLPFNSEEELQKKMDLVSGR